MTITLELPPEAEASLVAQAEARGLSLDAFLRALIKTQAAAVDPLNSAQAPTHGGDPDQVIDDIFDTVQVPPGVGEGAMRRENWYK